MKEPEPDMCILLFLLKFLLSIFKVRYEVLTILYNYIPKLIVFLIVYVYASYDVYGYNYNIIYIK